MRNRWVLALDLLAVVLAAYGAFALRFGWFFLDTDREFIPYVIAALVLKPSTFAAFHLYQRYWIYASVQDMVALVVGTVSSAVVMALAVAVGLQLGVLSGFPRSVVLMDWLLTVVVCGVIRLGLRVINESVLRRGQVEHAVTRRVLVIGGGQAGALVVREMLRNPQLGMQPAGFLDDDPGKQRKKILGVPVLGPINGLVSVAQSIRADEVVIAMPTAHGAVVRSIAEACRLAGLTSRTMPGVFEVLGGQVSVSSLRNVDITDLLQRRQIGAASAPIDYVSGRTVLVTGAGGSIGGELCRQIAHARPAELVMIGHGENSIFEHSAQLTAQFPSVKIVTIIADIRNRERMRRVFRRYRPTVVFHAAAHKHVPLMEQNPEEAVTNNVCGTRNVLEVAIDTDVERLVFISSDKAVAPTSVMGATKRLAEGLVREAARTHQRAFGVVRFGNVLGSRGSVVPIFKRQIAMGGPVTLTHPDMKRYFMTIPEAVHLVLRAGGLCRGGELFALNMGEPVRISDLAQDLIRLSGFSTDEIRVTYTGMRPGEKLVEELWEEGAIVSPTSNPDIMMIDDHDADAPVLSAERLEQLELAAMESDRLHFESCLAELIPTFTPSWLQRSLDEAQRPTT